jgi:methyl-accepting chemotaxis protein
MESSKVSSNRSVKWGASIIDRLIKLRPFAVLGKSIRMKLMVSILALALISIIAIGIISYTISSKALMKKAFDNLEAVRANKIAAIENYLYKSEGDMNTLLETVKTLRQEAFDQLKAVQTIKKNQIESYFSARLSDVSALSANPVVIEALNKFKNVHANIGTSKWRAVARVYNPWLAKYIEKYGYIDLFIISEKGRVLYTVEKDVDLGQNLRTGQLKNSPAGKAFRRGLSAPALQDFGVYGPSGDAPAAFVAAPVIDGGKTRGVVMLQIPIEQIDSIMQERTGLGKTGETYLVAADKLFRSDSRLVEDSTILDPFYTVNTEAVNKALTGVTGQAIVRNFKDTPVLSSYSPLEIPGLRWIIVAEISVAEAFAPRVENEIEDFFTTYKESYGYYDLYLLNPDGYLFYTVEQEADYHTNMLTGPYKNTNLGRLVEEVLKTKQFRFSDFEHYAANRNAPAAFVAQPLVYDDKVELVIAAQLSLDHINAIVQESAGLGETGESYLVGSDKLWRNNSNFLRQLGLETTVLNPKITVDTVASRSALAGNSGTQVIKDYRNVPVLSSWSPIVVQEPTSIDSKGVTWALISQIDLGEVRKPVNRMAWIVAGVLGGTIFLVIFITSALAGGLTNQVRKLMDLFSNIGMGDFQARAEIVSSDELGTLANALNAMLDNTLVLIQSREERDQFQASIMKLLEEISGLAEGDLTRRAEVTAEMTGALADSFNSMAEQLSEVVKNVKSATDQVTSTIVDVDESSTQLALASDKQSEQVSQAIESIAEMTVSIQQVSEHALQSASVSEQSTVNAKEGAEAVKETNKAMESIRENVQETARSIKRLGESSQEIGNIVQLINDIANRTSILALNASIQAAMAGDAGRGFAVVAEEVQRLAERSTNATKQIDALIKNIQGEINEAGTSMEQSIQRVVEGSDLANNAHNKLQEIDAVSSQLAQLIKSISMATTQQVSASENITNTMEEMGQVSAKNLTASQQTAAAMKELAETSEKLALSVEIFKLGDNGDSQSQPQLTAKKIETPQPEPQIAAEKIETPQPEPQVAAEKIEMPQPEPQVAVENIEVPQPEPQLEAESDEPQQHEHQPEVENDEAPQIAPHLAAENDDVILLTEEMRVK